MEIGFGMEYQVLLLLVIREEVTELLVLVRLAAAGLTALGQVRDGGGHQQVPLAVGQQLVVTVQAGVSEAAILKQFVLKREI